jgi:hypothetical protein
MLMTREFSYLVNNDPQKDSLFLTIIRIKMKTTVNVLQWLPRILSIAAILFISIFSLDVFSPGTPFWQQIGGFFIHNIPSFILLGILILAWNHEFSGGIGFIITGIIMSILIFIMNYKRTGSDLGQSLLVVALIGIPIIVVGILFLFSYYIKKKSTTNG